MNHEETLQAMKTLSTSPAATWIGTRCSDDGKKLIQHCTRCGAEEALELPAEAAAAFQGGARGGAVSRLVPPGFDEKLFAWKIDFQRAHEDCSGDKAA